MQVMRGCLYIDPYLCSIISIATIIIPRFQGSYYGGCGAIMKNNMRISAVVHHCACGLHHKGHLGTRPLYRGCPLLIGCSKNDF